MILRKKASQSETEKVSKKKKEKKSEETPYMGKCLGFFFLPKKSCQFQCENKNNINKRNTTTKMKQKLITVQAETRWKIRHGLTLWFDMITS